MELISIRFFGVQNFQIYGESGCVIVKNRLTGKNSLAKLGKTVLYLELISVRFFGVQSFSNLLKMVVLSLKMVQQEKLHWPNQEKNLFYLGLISIRFSWCTEYLKFRLKMLFYFYFF